MYYIRTTIFQGGNCCIRLRKCNFQKIDVVPVVIQLCRLCVVVWECVGVDVEGDHLFFASCNPEDNWCIFTKVAEVF